MGAQSDHVQSTGVEAGHAAASVTDALAVQNTFRPDLIIADLGMPGADGFSLLARLRTSPDEAIARTPVIAVTGYATVEDRAQTAAAGFAGHIAKPIDASELIAGILGVLRR